MTKSVNDNFYFFKSSNIIKELLNTLRNQDKVLSKSFPTQKVKLKGRR